MPDLEHLQTTKLSAFQNGAVAALPIKTIGALILGWLGLWIVNYALLKLGLPLHTTKSFPISIFDGPRIVLSGIPYLLLFLVGVWVTLKTYPILNVFQVWGIASLLIFLGNLGQGGIDAGLLKPFYETGYQYYHDAIKITDGASWLRSFNSSHLNLLMHTRMHPPFAVLSHYYVLNAFNNSVLALAIVFTLISSFTAVLVWNILKLLDVSLEKRNLISLFCALLPAINIYGAVCLDSIILTSSTLFILGLIKVLKAERFSVVGTLLMAIGLTATSLMSYLSTVLLAIAGLQALKDIVLERKLHSSFALAISLFVLLLCLVFLFNFYNYNYLESFLTSSALENPRGFLALTETTRYVATRFEGIGELALFTSFGFLALLFHPKKLGIVWTNIRDLQTGLILSMLIVIAAIFAVGTFRTGETTRALLFIYPLLALALTRAKIDTLKYVTLFAGMQTFSMQLLGGYFW